MSARERGDFARGEGGAQDRRTDPDPHLQASVTARRHRARRIRAVGVVIFVASAVAVVLGTGDSPPTAHKPGGGLTLTYVPDDFALDDDTEHLGALPGQHVRLVTYRARGSFDDVILQVRREVAIPFVVEAELRFDPAASRARVRDREAVESRGNGSYELAWSETDRVSLRVSTNGLSQSEVRRVAEGIRYDPEREDLDATAEPRDPGDRSRPVGHRFVVAEGQFDGLPWWLVAYESETGRCIDLHYYRSSGGSCGGDVPEGRAVDAGVAGGLDWQFVTGEVRRDAARVTVQLTTGDIITVLPVGRDAGFPVNFYAQPLSLDTGVVLVVAYDADGNEIGRDDRGIPPGRGGW